MVTTTTLAETRTLLENISWQTFKKVASIILFYILLSVLIIIATGSINPDTTISLLDHPGFAGTNKNHCPHISIFWY